MTGKLGSFEPDSIVCDDALAVMGRLPDGCANLVFCDWPYNMGKAAWDKGFDWRPLIPELVRVLRFNGALWVILGNPLELVDVSKAIVEAGGPPLINWVTWDKYNGATSDKGFMDGYTILEGNRSFHQMAEFLIYHADDGAWQKQSADLWSGQGFERRRGFIFEPLRAYLAGERDRAGFTSRQVDEALDNFMSGHYFGCSQWALPTAENYAKMRQLFNSTGGEYLRREYEDLRREYEDLRREYEDLRPTFNNPGRVSSVWPGPPAKRNGHETPKPEWLLRRIIEATTNEGDLVFDPFMGSGTTAVVAKQTGRHFIGCDISPAYVEMARLRVAQVDGTQLERIP